MNMIDQQNQPAGDTARTELKGSVEAQTKNGCQSANAASAGTATNDTIIQESADTVQASRRLGERPTELDLELCMQICRRIENGYSLQSVCEDDWRWPAYQTALLWLAQSEDFADWYTLSLIQYRDRLSRSFESLITEGPEIELLKELEAIRQHPDRRAAYEARGGRTPRATAERPVEPDVFLFAVICHLIANTSMSLQQICEHKRFPTFQVALRWIATNDDFALRYSLAVDKNLAMKEQNGFKRSSKEIAIDALSRILAAKKCGNTNALAVSTQVLAREIGHLVNPNPPRNSSPLEGVAVSDADAAVAAIIEQTDPITVAQIIIDQEG